jgi:hypothetical protein
MTDVFSGFQLISAHRVDVSIGNLEVSKKEPEFINFYGAQESIPRTIPLAYVAWRDGIFLLGS